MPVVLFVFRDASVYILVWCGQFGLIWLSCTILLSLGCSGNELCCDVAVSGWGWGVFYVFFME